MSVPEPGDRERGGFRVTIANGASVRTGAAETILAALQANGIDFPFVCRSGTCRTCSCDLLAGEVDLLPYAGFALTHDERANGRILACRAIPRSDCTIDLPDYRDRLQHPVRTFSATVTRVDRLSDALVRVSCAVPRDAHFDYAPGQYARLALGGRGRGLGLGERAIATIPRDGELAFHLPVEAGVGVGDALGVTGPVGTAYLRETHRGPIVAAAAAGAFAWLLSVVRGALAVGGDRAIVAYLHVASPPAWQVRALEALGAGHPGLDVRPVPAESFEDGVTARETQRTGAKAYVAASSATVAALRAIFIRNGFARRDVHARTVSDDPR